MLSTDHLPVRTPTFCTIAFPRNFTIASIRLQRKSFCAVAYISGPICALAYAQRTGANAASTTTH